MLVLSVELVPTHADTTVQTWQVTAECEDISTSYNCDDPANISAVFTAELEPGAFFDGASQESFRGPVPVVMEYSGDIRWIAHQLHAAANRSS